MAVKFQMHSKVALKSNTDIRGVVSYHHNDFALTDNYLYEVVWDIYKDHKTIYLADMLVDASTLPKKEIAK